MQKMGGVELVELKNKSSDKSHENHTLQSKGKP